MVLPASGMQVGVAQHAHLFLQRGRIWQRSWPSPGRKDPRLPRLADQEASPGQIGARPVMDIRMLAPVEVRHRALGPPVPSHSRDPARSSARGGLSPSAGGADWRAHPHPATCMGAPWVHFAHGEMSLASR